MIVSYNNALYNHADGKIFKFDLETNEYMYHMGIDHYGRKGMVTFVYKDKLYFGLGKESKYSENIIWQYDPNFFKK